MIGVDLMYRSLRLVHIMTVPLSLDFVRGQVGFMKEQGLEVFVITSPGEKLEAFCQRENVAGFAVNMSRRITPLQDLFAFFQLYRQIRCLHPTIVHCHTPKAGLLGMLAATLAGVPVRIYHIHGFPFMTATGWKRAFLKWSESISCALSHQVLCVSHSVREIALAEGICPPAKIKVLLEGSCNGVDALCRFNPTRVGTAARSEIWRSLGIPPGASVIGFVGRLARDKGFVELTEAWKRLRVKFPDLHLMVVGPPDERDPIPIEVERFLRGDPRVHMTGAVDDPAPMYAAMDVVVLPSYREGFGNTLLEAAAMQVPVVATRIPGCVDAVVDGVTGTLVPARDADLLADAISQYLRQPLLRVKVGKAARERVLRAFSQERMWEAVYAEYVRLLRDRVGLHRRTCRSGMLTHDRAPRQ